MSGSILLGQVAEHLATLEIACNRCDRKGRAAVDRLMAEHGRFMPIPTLLTLLSADCPKPQAGKMHEVCGAHMPQLPEIFMPKCQAANNLPVTHIVSKPNGGRRTPAPPLFEA
jgi:hypothetical protein